ncbi:MAG: TatD family nuclease-associated radical SAM protein [Gammaproteobacteria bacterium]
MNAKNNARPVGGTGDKKLTTAHPTLAYEIRDSLYLNVTDRCTLACTFCPKTRGYRRVHEYDLTLLRLPSATQVIDSIGDPTRYREVVFCGFGEPTLRLKLVLTVADYVKAGNVRVRINTDGLANRVYKRNVLLEMVGRVDELCVSMNAQNKQVYDRHCLPVMPESFDAMLAFLDDAARYIPMVTATAIDGLEGVDINACKKLALEHGVGFRRRVLDLVG